MDWQMDAGLVDDIIRRLLEVRGRPGKQVQLSETEICQLCHVSKEIFLEQPIFLELEAPIKICGNFSLLMFSMFVQFWRLMFRLFMLRNLASFFFCSLPVWLFVSVLMKLGF